MAAPPDRQSDHKVLIVYTGGTLGMMRNEQGALEVAPGYLASVLKGMPEMRHPQMPTWGITEFDPLLDSSDMGPEDWTAICEIIASQYYDWDGFVVIMGTDTMAYCASALSFMLENLGKPVIVTGSIIPFCEIYNDARRNLIVSLLFAARDDLPEVCVFFDDKLMRGNRTTKVSTNEMDAFDSPNFPYLSRLSASMHFTGAKDFQLVSNLVLPHPRARFRVCKNVSNNVLVIRLIPGFADEGLRVLVEQSRDLRALVLELYGTGNAPARKRELLDVLKVAIAKGIAVVVTTQCHRGCVALQEYELGRQFHQLGVISATDMTTEATVTKLAYLFGQGLPSDKVKTAMLADLRGELGPPNRSRL